MPTYSYACTACGHRFDAQQSFDDAALTECPECAGRLRKLFGAVGVVFKGSGFYRTDSRTSGGARSTASGSKASSGSTGSSASPKPTSTEPASTAGTSGSASTAAAASA